MEIISTDNAKHYTWGDVCDGWHLLQSHRLSVIQERVPPGAAEVMHYHETAQQFFFVLSGEATLEIGGRRFILGPQQGISVEPGTPHKLMNQGAVDVSFLVVSSPMSHGDRVVVE